MFGADHAIARRHPNLFSLLWDCAKHRVEWRTARLDMDRKCHVRAPIRYGRKSSSRCLTYTMVFSTACARKGKWGQAVVVSCHDTAGSPEALIGEAQSLWRAEQPPGAVPCHALGGSWGCVALLRNPNGQEIPADWLDCWKRTAAEDRQPPAGLNCAKGEKPAVDRDAMLQIPWPEPVDGEKLMSSLDALLATATDPTIENGQYPTPQLIAKAWNQADPKRCKYFWQNRKNGIFTVEDDSIESLLDCRHRCN